MSIGDMVNEGAGMRDVIGRDQDGTALRIGDEVRHVAAKADRFAVLGPVHSEPGAIALRRIEDNSTTWGWPKNIVRLSPAPAAEESETVRGWRKRATDGNWPLRTIIGGDLLYDIEHAVYSMMAHFESVKAFTARGRPLTLREVVDLLDPEPHEETEPPSAALVCGTCKRRGFAHVRCPECGTFTGTHFSGEPAAECKWLQARHAQPPAPAEPLACDECKAALVSQQWPNARETGDVAFVDGNGSETLCQYCKQRLTDTLASKCHGSPYEDWDKPSVVAAVVADGYEDSEVFERAGYDWP